MGRRPGSTGSGAPCCGGWRGSSGSLSRAPSEWAPVPCALAAPVAHTQWCSCATCMDLTPRGPRRSRRGRGRCLRRPQHVAARGAGARAGAARPWGARAGVGSTRMKVGGRRETEGPESAPSVDPPCDELESPVPLVPSELSRSSSVSPAEPLAERGGTRGRGSGSSSSKEACGSTPSPTDMGGAPAAAARLASSAGSYQLTGVQHRSEPSGARTRTRLPRRSA